MIVVAAQAEMLLRKAILTVMTSPIRLLSTDFDGTLHAEFESPPVPEALQNLIPLVDKEPGLLDASRFQLAFAALLGKGPDALTAWRSYFHLWKAGSARAPLSEAGTRIARLLPALAPEKAS